MDDKMHKMQEAYRNILLKKVNEDNPVPTGTTPQNTATQQNQTPVTPAPQGLKPLDANTIQTLANSLASQMLSAISKATTSAEAHQILGKAQDLVAVKITAKFGKK